VGDLMNIVKKLIIKSYTKDYYIAKHDFLETRYMKESILHGFKAYMRYTLAMLWLNTYTAVIDFFINTCIMILIISYKGFVFILALLFFYLINEFGLYY